MAQVTSRFFEFFDNHPPDLLERVTLIRLLYSLYDGLIHTEGDGDTEHSQEHVGHDTDGAACGQSKKHKQRATKH